MKNKIFATAAIAIAFLLGACAVSTASAEQEWPLKIWSQNSNGMYNTLCVVDSETGVNYVVVSVYDDPYGKPITSISITPRLNADGTLYISD